jgi:hypothetical protein
VKYAKKTNSNQTTPLVKIIPSLVAGVVIASLSASVTANQLNTKLQTPAQVEQALTALLDSRDATLQLASYTSKQPSNSVNQTAVVQAVTKKVDHSQKSVAELVLAGLAITSEAKNELSSSASVTEPVLTAVTQDYAVADIVSIKELAATANDSADSTSQNSKFNSDDAEKAALANVDDIGVVLVEAEMEIQPVAQEVASISTVASNQVSSNINEPEEDALPAMPVSEAANTLIADEQLESVESFAMGNTDETEIAESEALDIAVVETDAVEAEVAEIAAVETEAVEAEVAEIAAVETEAVEAEVAEIAVVETEAVEAEVAEIAAVETEAVEAEVAEIAAVETEAVEAEVAEEVPPSIVNVEESAPIELASVSVSVPSSLSSAQSSVTNTSKNALVTDNVDANVTVAIRSAGCPEDFNKVSIPVNGKLCQIFAADFPASMILFIPQTPEEVIQYYLASSNSFVEPKTIKQRTMLKSADNNTTLIISKDGGGTQVDILVKSPVI